MSNIPNPTMSQSSESSESHLAALDRNGTVSQNVLYHLHACNPQSVSFFELNIHEEICRPQQQLRQRARRQDVATHTSIRVCFANSAKYDAIDKVLVRLVQESGLIAFRALARLISAARGSMEVLRHIRRLFGILHGPGLMSLSQARTEAKLPELYQHSASKSSPHLNWEMSLYSSLRQQLMDWSE